MDLETLEALHRTGTDDTIILEAIWNNGDIHRIQPIPDVMGIEIDFQAELRLNTLNFI